MDNTKLSLWKKRKKELGWTHDDLARESGVSRRTIAGIFSGDPRYESPTYNTIQAIEAALGLSETEAVSPAVNGLTDNEKRLLKAFNSLIPPMQEYVLETTEKLASQPQNVAKRA